MAILSLGPASEVPGFEIPYADKVGHFGMYAILVLLLQRAMGSASSRNRCRDVAVLVGCAGYGALMEYGQLTLHFAERTFSWADMAANTAGAASALAALSFGRQSSRSGGAPTSSTTLETE